MSDFAGIQKRFYQGITCCKNPSEVILQMIKVTSTGEFTDFTGDSQRVVEKEIRLHCRYQRYLNDKQREKAGVTEEVTMSVFISPLELEQKFASFDFPSYVRSSYSGMAVMIFNQHHEIESIRDLEPQQTQGRVTCVAYQINLKAGKGIIDFD